MARDHTCPATTLIRPTRKSGASLDRLSGNAIARPWLKECDRTSVMIIPMPMERTMVLLMSTSPRLAMTFWNSGAETRLSATEETTPARIAQDEVVTRGPQHDPGDVHGEDHHLGVGEVDDHRHQQEEVEAGDQQDVDAARARGR